MFLDNKYTRWYNNIISSAIARSPKNDYFEKHHIIPKSLGGSNKVSNIVKLTAREHFVCHLLLTKMLSGKEKAKMVFALSMLVKIKNIGKNCRYTPSSRLYEYSKQIFKQELMDFWTEEKRKSHSEKIKKATLGKKKSDAHRAALKNRSWSDRAIQTRLDNCLKNAQARAGTQWSEARRTLRNDQYYEKNKEMAMRVFELYDQGNNALTISKLLNISWDKANKMIIRRSEFINRLMDKK